jgi:hypothetical protein
MPGFSLSFEIVTPESAEHGEADSRGMIAEGLTLRDALALFEQERSGGYVESDSYPVMRPRWFTCYGEPDSVDGSTRSVSLHLPESISEGTRRRIGRLLNCYGLKP